MSQKISHIALLVNDYDEAIEFYTEKLNFTVLEDTKLNDSKRWVLLAPSKVHGFSLLLAKAANEEQKSRVGNQTGGRVFLFLNTDNFQKDYNNLLEKKVKVVREPVIEAWGTVAVFEDLYGNLWDLIEPTNKI
ncbi:VOC family protein [soil metagenome]